MNILAEPSLAKCLRFPLWSPIKKISVSRVLHYMFLRVLSVGALPSGSPHRASLKRVKHHCQSLTELPQRERQRDSVYKTLLLSLKVPGKWTATSMVPKRGSYVVRCSGSRANGLCVHISQESPVMELSHETGKTSGHHTWNPTWMEGLHTVGCGLVP